MKFVDEIDFGGVSLFVLTAHHEVHLLQLVEESNALLCDMSAFALLQDIVHQCQFLRSEAAKHIDRICLDVFVVL